MQLAENSKPKYATRKFQSLDIHIGGRIRLCRAWLGITDTQLADAIGVTGARMQKFECGEDHIEPLRLFDIAVALNVPLHFFFEDKTGPSLQASNQPPAHKAVAPASVRRWGQR